MYCMSLPIFCYHSAYRGGGGYLSICYLCQVPFSPVLVFVEDFPSLPRIVYLLDVSSALPRLQKLLTAQGNLIAAFRERCSGVILQTSSMNLLVGVVISLFYFRATFLYSNSSLETGAICDCNGIWTHNHLGLKQTLNPFAKLAKWLSCVVSTVSRKELPDIQATIECRFTLKHT